MTVCYHKYDRAFRLIMLNKRSILGTLLFLILVGEPAVGFKSGLYTLTGLIVFPILYFILFQLYEALIIKFKLSYLSLLPLTFGVYSVLVTGLLHGELADYIIAPHNNLGTTLIRIQCSFYPIFVFYILNKFTKRNPKTVPNLIKILLSSLIFMLILTPSKSIGFIKMADTLKTAPSISLIFLVLGVLSIIFALKIRASLNTKFSSKVLNILTLLLFILCLIPSLQSFILVLFIMPTVGIIYLLKPVFRNNEV